MNDDDRTGAVCIPYCDRCQQPWDDVCLDCDRLFCALCDRVCPGCGFDTRQWYVMRNGTRIWVPVEREQAVISSETVQENPDFRE